MAEYLPSVCKTLAGFNPRHCKKTMDPEGTVTFWMPPETLLRHPPNKRQVIMCLYSTDSEPERLTT